MEQLGARSLSGLRHPLLQFCLLGSALLAVSCVDGVTDSRLAPRAAVMQVVSGDNQQGQPGQMLTDPLVVRVLDEIGAPVADQVVNFQVTQGGGSVFAGTGLTNAEGLVQERWTLGQDTTLAQAVEARAVDPQTGDRVVFATFTASFGSSDTTALLVSNVQVASGKSYEVVANGLLVGAKRYTDRAYTIADPVPTEVAGLTFIRTANDDKSASAGSTSFLSFEVNRDVTVYVAHDDRVSPRPTWLSGWTDTGTDLKDSDGASNAYSLFRKSFSAGTVTLGSNVSTASSTVGMYTVAIHGGSTGGGEGSTDTEAPTVPQGLSAMAVSSSRIDLSWSASTDNVGVSGYRIYRGGTQVGTSSTTSYSDTGLSAATSYTYAVAAYDAAGNTSSQSAETSATTESGTSSSEGAPYPGSDVIAGVSLDWSSHIRLAPGSDNFPVTWGADDHQYTSWGDGGGFGGTNSDGRVSLGVGRVEGTASSYTGYNVWGGKNAENPAQFGGKSYGILFVGTVLYMWVSPGSDHYNWDYARLYKSTDQAATWTATSVEFTEAQGVGIPGILQFGRDYAGARDGYVYSYFINIQDASVLQVQRPGEVVLVRAPIGSLEQPSAYEWFAGLDGSGNPTWSTNVAQRQPVFVDPNGVGWNLSVSYNAPLGRYLLMTEHGQSFQGRLGIFDAPEPWGPWTTVHYSDSFGSGAIEQSTFYWNFSNKWLSSDGRNFVMVFSGIQENDSWNTVHGTFHLR